VQQNGKSVKIAIAIKFARNKLLLADFRYQKKINFNGADIDNI
jgi:hypothetical protein